MLTQSAARGAGVEGVTSRAWLRRRGFDAGAIRRQVEAGRWRLVGLAIVAHRGPLTRLDCLRIALINCGPRSALTAFTALESCGLKGWYRDSIYVLVPMGTKPPPVPGIAIRLRRVGTWRAEQVTRRMHRPAHALVVAASCFEQPRPACAILAVGVQQGLVSVAELRAAVDARTRTRHRAALSAAVDDIAMGAQALTEIDFVALCRRHRLPAPTLQSVRVEQDGRRRYLDAAWDLPDGRRVAVEVDGAVHLEVQRWQDDQLRQNEIVLGGTGCCGFRASSFGPTSSWWRPSCAGRCASKRSTRPDAAASAARSGRSVTTVGGVRRLGLTLALVAGLTLCGIVPAVAAPTSTSGARYGVGGYIVGVILLILAALLARRRFRR